MPDSFETHAVTNQPPPFEDVNLFTSDAALSEAIHLGQYARMRLPGANASFSNRGTDGGTATTAGALVETYT